MKTQREVKKILDQRLKNIEAELVVASIVAMNIDDDRFLEALSAIEEAVGFLRKKLLSK